MRLLFFVFLLFTLCSCTPSQMLPSVTIIESSSTEELTTTTTTEEITPEEIATEEITTEVPISSSEELLPLSLIVPSGMTLDSRFLAPEGYEKVSAPQGSLLFFMRNMELKPDGSPILLYDGTVETEDHDAAVFAMDVGTVNLQQCADSIMRIYAEYLWSIGAYDKIGFHLTSGFWMDYANWRNGNRISVNGSDVQWVMQLLQEMYINIYFEYNYIHFE